MKTFFNFICIVATAAVCQFATADVITQVVTGSGSTGATNINVSSPLQSFVAGGVTFDTFIGVSVTDPTPPELLGPQMVGLPASVQSAVSDLDLGTGALNNGTDAVYDLSGQTLAASSTIFFFGNGNGSVEVDPATGNAIGSGGTTPPGALSFVDAGGAVIGTLAPDFFFQDPGANSLRAPNLLSFDFIRGNGNDLNNRTVSGAVFSLGAVNFTSGGISDIAGFSIGSGNTDVQDVGIAFAAAIPEPSAGVLLISGLASVLIRRRR